MTPSSKVKYGAEPRIALIVVAVNACDSNEYDKNSTNTNCIFGNKFVDNFDDNSKDNFEGINEVRVKTRRIELIDKFKT
ncbi:hypothetical protein A9G27_10715 [Gilliamella sp. Bim3-2]|nr:hypothetical protein A9G27_10715 [Gilliamella apicola]